MDCQIINSGLCSRSHDLTTTLKCYYIKFTIQVLNCMSLRPLRKVLPKLCGLVCNVYKINGISQQEAIKK